MPSTPARRNLASAFDSVATPSAKRRKMAPTPQTASMKMHRSMLKKSETKFFVKDTTWNNNGNVTLPLDIISPLTVGNNNETRVGNKIKVTKIEVRVKSDSNAPLRVQLAKCNNVLTLPGAYSDPTKAFVDTLDHNLYWTMTDVTATNGTSGQVITFTKNFSLGTNITFNDTQSIENLLFLYITKAAIGDQVILQTKVHFKE